MNKSRLNSLSFCFLLALGLACAAPHSVHAASPEIVIFDGSDTTAFQNLFEYKLVDGVLKGKGRLHGKAHYSNYELNIEYRFTQHFGALDINYVPFHPITGPTQQKEAVGTWQSVRVLYRHMPRELAKLTVPQTGFEKYQGKEGKERKFSEDNVIPVDKLHRDKNGFIQGDPVLFISSEQPLEIRRLAIRPLEPESPREFLELKGKALEEFSAKGKEVFATYCFACHGDGIGDPINPLSRSFAQKPMLNGSDRLSIYNTLTEGYKTMVPQLHLTPEQRHQVTAHITEGIFKEHNPSQYKPVDPAKIQAMPYPLYTAGEEFARRNKDEDTRRKDRGTFRDHGPVVVTWFGKQYRNAANVLLDENTALSYDLYGMNLINVRTDGFLDMLATHYFQQRGESIVQPTGKPVPELKTWFWRTENQLQSPGDGLRNIPETRDYSFNGYYLYERSSIFSYNVLGRRILEQPSLVTNSKTPTISHRLRVDPGKQALQLAIAEGVDSLPSTELGTVQTIEQKEGTLSVMVGGQTSGLSYTLESGFVLLNIPASDQPTEFTLVRSSSEINPDGAQPLASTPSFQAMLEGGARRWPKTYTMAGTTADDTAAYVMDTLPVPYENDYNAWMRTTAVAFFSDGRAVVTTHGGDVWIVSGIDKDLKAVTWSRFAAGLYQAFGVNVVDGLIYVTTRNGIVRLHDNNSDGEADYYEQFFADPQVSGMWHGFNFDLVRDNHGNFYYAKSGQFTDIVMEGGTFQISPDGKSYTEYATGFRTPNGMGTLPDGRITYGENQGGWVPAGKISIVEEGSWHGGAVRSSPPERIPAPPLINLPQEVDNSCGGQLWIDDERFGPYANMMMHTSCGHARAMMIFIDEFEETAQGATVSFPFKFDSGVMRLAINPQDGQVYLTGTRGWQINAPKDGNLQRIRYTGKPEALLMDVKARSGGIALSFNQSIDPASLDISQFKVSAWNYKRTGGYGSQNYKPSTPGAVGKDSWSVSTVSILDDTKTLWIALPDIMPAHQVKVEYQAGFTSGETLADKVHLTIHKLIPR